MLFFANKTNLGRGKNINSLAEKAKFDWLLILDCDTFPRDPNFIKNYIAAIEKMKLRLFLAVSFTKPKNQKKSNCCAGFMAQKRSTFVRKKDYKSTQSCFNLQFIDKKEIFIQNPFDASITKYGYEDLCFISKLELKNIPISHIDNPTFHLNLETSILFLNKTKIALENLNFIIDSKTIPKLIAKLLLHTKLLKKLKLTK